MCQSEVEKSGFYYVPHIPNILIIFHVLQNLLTMKYFFIITLLVITTITNAQINATTEDGRKVLLNEQDNTWQFVEESTSLESENTEGDYSKGALLHVEDDEVAGSSYLTFV